MSVECQKCYWRMICCEDEVCEDFTSLEDDYILEEYNKDLKERCEVYLVFVEEMNE